MLVPSEDSNIDSDRPAIARRTAAFCGAITTAGESSLFIQRTAGFVSSYRMAAEPAIDHACRAARVDVNRCEDSMRPRRRLEVPPRLIKART